jgi:hypothetical protein
MVAHLRGRQTDPKRIAMHRERTRHLWRNKPDEVELVKGEDEKEGGLSNETGGGGLSEHDSPTQGQTGQLSHSASESSDRSEGEHDRLDTNDDDDEYLTDDGENREDAESSVSVKLNSNCKHREIREDERIILDRLALRGLYVKQAVEQEDLFEDVSSLLEPSEWEC